MKITKPSTKTVKGPADWFTGDVYIDFIASPSDVSRISAAKVHFTPGARTAWHTHPHGQTIHVIQGTCLCQKRGEPIEVIPTGGSVFFEPGEEHWHGASPDQLMMHLAMQQADAAGNTASWGEHVTDEEYGQAK